MKRKHNMANSVEKKTEPVKKRRLSPDQWHMWIVYGLCLVGFLIYANTFAASFHFDDLAVIVNNPAIHNPWDFARLFDAFNTRLIPGWTFAINFSLGQLKVAGYHFFNIWLHVCNAVLVYALVHQLIVLDKRTASQNAFVKIATAGGAAAIFLVHPLATQAVDYIWQRSTLLAAFFYLGTIVLYLQARSGGGFVYCAAAWIACLCAMLSKEIAFTLPAMIILMEVLFLRDNKPQPKMFTWLLPFVLMMGLIPFLLGREGTGRIEMMRPYSLTQGVGEDVVSRADYLLTQVNALRTYVRFFILPVGQNVDHDYPSASSAGWLVWSASFALLAGFLATGFYFLKRCRLISLAVFWFFITHAVESSVTSADFFVEHRMYLPMIGLCVGFAVVLVEYIFKKNIQSAMIVFVLIAIIFSVMTIRRNFVWRDDITLWSDACEKSPQKSRPVNNRGLVFMRLGFLDLALNDFNRAIALNSKYADAYQNRGHLYKMTKDDAAALSDYTTVLSLEPRNADIYAARGGIYKRRGDVEAALKDFNEAIRLKQDDAEFFNNRAYLHQIKNDFDLALADYSTAIKIQPDYVYAYNNRGNMYIKRNDANAAVEDYTRALTFNPAFAEAYLNRAVAYFDLGMFKESKADLDRARAGGLMPNAEFVRRLKNAFKEKNIPMDP